MKSLFARNKTQLYYAFLLLLVIIVQIAIILHYTFERHNYMIDEIWTFNTANHYYFPFLFQSTKPYLNQWLPASFWINSVVVDPNHTFSYDSVFYNMSLDNQPPFYFIVIHTVCSLFPGEFSRWFGIVPNLLFFVLIQFTFYAIGLKLFGKNAAALGLCMLYGSCWGAINNVMLIRMYTMLTFFAILTYWVHLQMIEEVKEFKEQQFSKKTLILVFIFSVFGFLTHYYFLIYATYMFLGTVLLLLFYHRTHMIKRYFLTLLGALLSCVFINPCIPAQFIGTTGNQGSATWHNLVQPDFLNRLSIMSKLISQDLLGHKARVFIILLLLLVIAKIISDVWKNVSPSDITDPITATWEKESRTFSFSIHFNTVRPGLFLAVFTSVLYFLTASKIVPYYENRYMYIIYPLVIVFLFSILFSLLKTLKLKQSVSLVITVLVILGLNVNYYSRNHIKFLDDSYPKMLATISKDYSDVNMISVTNSPNWWPVVTNLLLFREVPNTLMMPEQRLPEIKDVVDSLPSNPDSFLTYRGNNCKIKPKDFVEMVAKISGYKKYRLIGKQFGEIYVFSRE